MKLFKDFSVEACILDKDGTLFDTESVWIDAYRQLLAPYGLQHDLETHARMTGASGEACVQILQARHAALPQGEDRLVELMTEMRRLFRALRRERGVQPLPGVARFLEGCVQLQMPLAIATSAPREDTLQELDVLGWRQWFRAIVTADDVKRHKPEPDIYLEAARQLGKPVHQCLAFEDGGRGFESAHRAGMKVIFVQDARFGAVAPVGAARVIGSFEELLS